MSPKTKSNEVSPTNGEPASNQAVSQDSTVQSTVQNSTPIQQTEQPASEPKNQETKKIGLQPSNLTLELKWSTKNLLINHLNQLSAVVHKKTITKQIQALLVRDNDHLLLILANLPLKTNTDEVAGESLESLQCAPIEDLISNELFLDIDASFRIEIIQNLITNKNYAISYHCSVANSAKIELLRENNRIINRLLELPVQVKNHLVISDLSFYFCKREMESQAMRQEIDRRTCDLVRRESDKAIRDGEISSLKDEESLNGDATEEHLCEKAKEPDTNADEAVYTFEMDDVAKFFEPDINVRCSNLFLCSSAKWSIRAVSKKRNGSKCLDLYVYSHNSDKSKFSCSLFYKLILLGQRPDVQPRVKEFKNTFDKSSGFGCKNFITYDELRAVENGFLVNDQIKLQTHLKVNKIKHK